MNRGHLRLVKTAPPPRRHVSITVPDDLTDLLDAVCLGDRIKPADLVKEVLRQYLLFRMADDPELLKLIEAREAWRARHQ